MQENDIIKDLINIETQRDVEVKDIKSPLLLFNLMSSKYVAALRAANILSAAKIRERDWRLFCEIVTDLDSFLADPTEVDFMQDVFLEVLYNSVDDVDIIMNEEVLNVSDEEYERFYEYIVTSDEIELFQNIYIDFITSAIGSYKEGFMEFDIDLKLSNKWISAVYKDEKTFKNKLEHFKKSFYAFWIYNGFQNVKMLVKRSFLCIHIKFEIREIV